MVGVSDDMEDVATDLEEEAGSGRTCLWAAGRSLSCCRGGSAGP